MNYTTYTNATIELIRQTNSNIYKELANYVQIKVNTPVYRTMENGKVVEYPHPQHPKYRDALEVARLDRAVKAQKSALSICVKQNSDIIEQLKRQYRFKFLKVDNDTEIWLNYLYENLSENDIKYIIRYCFLTENEVLDIFNTMVTSVTRNGVMILDAHLKNGLNSKINLESVIISGQQLVHPVDEFITAKDTNINWLTWETLENNKKAETIALYRLHRIIANHAEDEAQIEAERKSKAK